MKTLTMLHLAGPDGKARCHWKRRGHTTSLHEVTCKRCIALALATGEAGSPIHDQADTMRRLRPLFGDRLQVFADHAVWLAGRSGSRTIGGSDVAAILGVSPWRSPWDVWLSFAGEEREVSASKAADFERGRRWEARVLEDYAEASAVELLSLPGPCIVRHATEEWAAGSPDAFGATANGLLGIEAKTARYAHDWGESGQIIEAWGDGAEAILPPHYALQVYWYLEVTGLERWDVAVAIPQRGDFPEVRTYTVLRDATTQAAILDAVGQWRERHLVGGEPPATDGSDGCKRGLARLFPGNGSKAVRPATDAEAALVADLAHVRASAKELDRRQRELQAQLGQLMQDDYGVTLGDEPGAPKVLWIPSKGRTSIDSKRLQAEFPDAYAACSKQGQPSRSFRFYGFNDSEED